MKACLISPRSAGSPGSAVGFVRKEKISPPLKTDGKVANFFNGRMEKLGFGAPECFFLNGRIKADPLLGVHQVYTSPVAASVAARSSQSDDAVFFPAVGYFNRNSSNGTRTVALGVGFSEGRFDEYGDPGARLPEAKVSLMVGFGF